MNECCDASGGRVVITANGNRWAARSAVNLMPTKIERTPGANQDGSLYVTTKPHPAEAELTLSDRCGMMLEDILGCPIDVTIDLIDVRRKYFFTKAVVVGRPTLNSETGEIRGVKIVSNDIKATNY